jgi:hypothetical protein
MHVVPNTNRSPSLLLVCGVGVLDVVRLATAHLASLGRRSEFVLTKALLELTDSVVFPRSSGDAQIHHDL